MRKVTNSSKIRYMTWYRNYAHAKYCSKVKTTWRLSGDSLKQAMWWFPPPVSCIWNVGSLMLYLWALLLWSHSHVIKNPVHIWPLGWSLTSFWSKKSDTIWNCLIASSALCQTHFLLRNGILYIQPTFKLQIIICKDIVTLISYIMAKE